MQTRVEKWKKYRAKIENNFLLSESIINTHPDLKKSLDELVKFFPHIKSKINLTNKNENEQNIFLENNLTFDKYSIVEIDILQKQLEKIGKSTKTNLAYINQLDFSSKQLDDLIKKLK